MPKYKSTFLNKIEQPEPEQSEQVYQLSGLQFTFKNATNDDTAELDIDGAIGFDWMKWYEDEPQNDAVTIKRALRDVKAKNLIVNINSLGGDVNDGLMIHDLLKERGNVTTVIRGLTASAATVISQAGHRKMSANAKMLVHNGLGFLFGWYNPNQLNIVLDDLNAITDTIAGVYAKAGSKDKEYYRDLMNEFNGRGKWLSAEQALEAGLIDEIYEPGEEESETVQNTIENFQNELEQFRLKNMNAFLQTLK